MAARSSREGQGNRELPLLLQICLMTATALMASYAASGAADYPENPVAAGRRRLRLESAFSPPPSTLSL